MHACRLRQLKKDPARRYATLTRSVWVPPATNTRCRSVGSKARAALNLSSRRIFATRVSPLDVVESCCNNRPLPATGRQSGERDQLLHELYLATEKGIKGPPFEQQGQKSRCSLWNGKKKQTEAAGRRHPP